MKDKLSKIIPVDKQLEQPSIVNKDEIKKEEILTEENSTTIEEETNQKRRFGYPGFHEMPARGAYNGRDSGY